MATTTLASSSSTSSSSSSSSPRCVPFGFRRGGDRRARRLPAPANAHGPGGPPAAECGRPLCRAAEVVGGGIRGAFFASLDHCNCVEVSTNSFRMVDAAAPLMRDAASSGDDEGAAAAAGKGRGRARIGRKQRRGGGLGCCAANSTIN